MKSFLVVGAGSSSLAFCSAILEREDHELIIIHEGPDNDLSLKSQNFTQHPALWARAATNSNHSRMAFINGNTTMRKVSYFHGVGVGGSSNINAMIWSLGDLRIFDRFWPLTWNSRYIESLNDRLRESLNLSQIGAYGGIDQQLQESNRLCKNSSRNSYLSTTIQSSDGGRKELRMNIADQLLKEYRKKISYHNHTKVLYIEFHESVAVGIRLKSLITGEESSIQLGDLSNNCSEIILCAGVFESPRILYDSFRFNHRLNPSEKGDGRFANIKKRCHLQDHVLLPLIFMGNWWSGNHNVNFKKNDGHGPANGIYGWIYLDENGNLCSVQTSATETGSFSSDILSSQNQNDLSPSISPIARIQLVFIDGRFCLDLLPNMLLPHYDSKYAPFYTNYVRPFLVFIIKVMCGLSVVKWLSTWVFGTLVCLVCPFSTGSLQFENTDNQDTEITSQTKFKPSNTRIDLGHYNDPRDADMMTKGLSTARNIIKTTRGLWCIEVFPGPLLLALAQEAYIRLYSNTYFHACGSCPMASGRDHDNNNDECESSIDTNNITLGTNNVATAFKQAVPAVVDEKLRVIGIKRLRVADASVIPVNGIPSAPIASVCMAIGLAAAGYVIEDET